MNYEFLLNEYGLVDFKILLGDNTVETLYSSLTIPLNDYYAEQDIASIKLQSGNIIDIGNSYSFSSIYINLHSYKDFDIILASKEVDVSRIDKILDSIKEFYYIDKCSNPLYIKYLYLKGKIKKEQTNYKIRFNLFIEKVCKKTEV